MSHLQYFDYPGYGAYVRTVVNYSQAVRLPDNTIHISGQGGWDAADANSPAAIPKDINEEMDNVYKNVQLTLEKAGGKGWSQVYKVRAYVVGPLGPDGQALQGALIKNLKKWCPDHQPVVTLPGVESLAFPGMRVELEVEAHLGN